MRRLEDLYPDSKHVSDFNLNTSDDLRICRIAIDQGFVIVTQDEDFSELVHMFDEDIKVIWMTYGNTSTSHRERMLRAHHEQIEAFAVDQMRRLFVID